jgi:hypothetical protein
VVILVILYYILAVDIFLYIWSNLRQFDFD